MQGRNDGVRALFVFDWVPLLSQLSQRKDRDIQNAIPARLVKALARAPPNRPCLMLCHCLSLTCHHPNGLDHWVDPAEQAVSDLIHQKNVPDAENVWLKPIL